MLQNRLDRFSHLSRRLVTILAGGGAVLVSGAVNAAPERIFHFASPGMSSILRGGSTFNCPSLRAYGQDSARRRLKHMSLRFCFSRSGPQRRTAPVFAGSLGRRRLEQARADSG